MSSPRNPWRILAVRCRLPESSPISPDVLILLVTEPQEQNYHWGQDQQPCAWGAATHQTDRKDRWAQRATQRLTSAGNVGGMCNRTSDVVVFEGCMQLDDGVGF